MLLQTGLSTYRSRAAISNCVSTSANDACAIATCCKYSRVVALVCPSAIFDGTDTAARRIWFVSPYSSVLGNSGGAIYGFHNIHPALPHIQITKVLNLAHSIKPIAPASHLPPPP